MHDARIIMINNKKHKDSELYLVAWSPRLGMVVFQPPALYSGQHGPLYSSKKPQDLKAHFKGLKAGDMVGFVFILSLT